MASLIHAPPSGPSFPSADGKLKMDEEEHIAREALARLREMKRAGAYVVGDLPRPGAEEARFIESAKRNLKITSPEDVKNDHGLRDEVIGRLYIIYAGPALEEGASLIGSEAQYSGQVLSGNEWSALFKDVLHCPMREDEEYVLGSDLGEYTERVRLKFQRSIPDYPMLGNIWDMYVDVHYNLEEVERLRDECLRIQSSTSHPLALEAVEKLLRAANHAISSKSDLSLLCD